MSFVIKFNFRLEHNTDLLLLVWLHLQWKLLVFNVHQHTTVHTKVQAWNEFPNRKINYFASLKLSLYYDLNFVWKLSKLLQTHFPTFVNKFCNLYVEVKNFLNNRCTNIILIFYKVDKKNFKNSCWIANTLFKYKIEEGLQSIFITIIYVIEWTITIIFVCKHLF